MAKDLKDLKLPTAFYSSSAVDVADRNRHVIQAWATQNNSPESLKKQINDFRRVILVVAGAATLKPEEEQEAVDNLSSLVIHSAVSGLKMLAAYKEQSYSVKNLITTRKYIYKHAFEGLPRNQINAFFDNLDKLNIADDTLTMLEYMARAVSKKESVLPHKTQQELHRWVKNKPNLDTKLLEDAEKDTPKARAEEKKPDAESLTLFGVLIAGKLTAVNDIAQTGDVTFTSHARDSDALSEIRTNPRREQLVQIMKDAGFKDIAWYSVNFDREGKKTSEGANPDHSYYLLNAQENNKTQFQLLVCDVVGHATYILRNPVPTDTQTLIRFSNLQKDDSVFKISYFSPEQWARQVKIYSLTPLKQLDAQIKTRIYWADKKDDVIETFGNHYIETGTSYATNDKSIIAHGPLTDKTTPQRMYGALRTGAIKGLEGTLNFNQLGRFIFGDDFNPCAISRPVLAFSAPDAFKDAVLHIQLKHTLPPMNISFERALKAGTVYDLDKVADKPEGIRSFHDFLEHTGVALKDENGELAPVPERTINSMARLLQLSPKTPEA